MKKSYPKPQKFIPRNPQKYVGDVNNIISRSGLETSYMRYFDMSSNIVQWASEEIVINYINPFDNKIHRYFPDFYIQTNNGDKFLVEIKPHSQCLEPKQTKGKRQKTLINEQITYQINQSKWKAATAMCLKNNMKFIVMTEKDLK